MSTEKDTEALVARMESWNRCYPGNINIEVTIDEAATTLRAQQDRIRELERDIECVEKLYLQNKRAKRYWTKRAETAENRVKELEAHRDRERDRALRYEEAFAQTGVDLAEAMEVIKPFASVRYMGANAFNRADLSDNDFRAARAFMQKMEKSDADNG